MASHVTLIDESLLEEASRYPSSLPRFLCALGSQDSPSSSFSKVERALVAASMGHDALIRPDGEEGEEALDPLRVILADRRVMGCLPVLELGRGLTKEEGGASDSWMTNCLGMPTEGFDRGILKLLKMMKGRKE